MSDGVTWRETVAHYTLLPVAAVGIVTPIACLGAWALGLLSYPLALALPWFDVGLLCVYLSLFGDAVMPAETYRRRRADDD